MAILIRELSARDERRSAGAINRQWRAGMDIMKRRQVLEHLPATPGYTRKQSEAFLDDFAETKKENAILHRALEDAGIEHEKLQSQLAWHREEMKRISKGREEYRNQYSELLIQLKVIVTTATSSGESCKQAVDAVIRQAKLSMEAVTAAMTAAGVDPIDSDGLPPADENTLKLAATFGANNRKE
jgi:septal ring factor EnvC (AmiA/AmiB activator)